MKKIFLILTALIMLSACATQMGDVEHSDLDIIINGKKHKLVSVCPCTGCHSIWILYPEDPNQPIPTVVNYTEQHGKSSINRSVIVIP